MADQPTLTRRLARIALVAFVRSTATGLGACAIKLLIWWITTH